MSNDFRGIRFGLLLFGVFFVLLPVLLNFIDLKMGWRVVGGTLSVFRLLSLLLFLCGFLLTFFVTLLFGKWGHGTPVPLFPPQKLVSSGLFRHSRNPMYIGYLLINLSMALWLGGGLLLLVPPMLLIFLHWYLVNHEEPILAERFGEDFYEYCRRTPRWL